MKLLTRSFVILLDRVSNFLNGKNSNARMSLPYGLAMFAFSKSTLVFDRNFYSELEFEMVAFSLSPISCVTTAKQYASAFPVLNISRASPTRRGFIIIILAFSILDRPIPRHKTSRPETNDFKIQTICRGFPREMLQQRGTLHLRIAPVPGSPTWRRPGDSPTYTRLPHHSTREGYRFVSL